MPGAINSSEMAEIKAALQIPFDTFVQFPVSVILKTEKFGVFKGSRTETEYPVIGYKTSNKGKDGAPLPTRQGGLDLNVTEKVIFNPTILVAAGLMATKGSIPLITATRDDLVYEGKKYQINRVTPVGWLDSEYQMIEVECSLVQSEIKG